MEVIATDFGLENGMDFLWVRKSQLRWERARQRDLTRKVKVWVVPVAGSVAVTI